MKGLAAVHFQRGLVRLVKGDIEGASRAYDRVFELTPEDAAAFYTRSEQSFPKGSAVGFETLIRYVNALIHQDFEETGTSVAIELYSDRLEISSPGQPSTRTERFMDGYM